MTTGAHFEEYRWNCIAMHIAGKSQNLVFLVGVQGVLSSAGCRQDI